MIKHYSHDTSCIDVQVSRALIVSNEIMPTFALTNLHHLLRHHLGDERSLQLGSSLGQTL